MTIPIPIQTVPIISGFNCEIIALADLHLRNNDPMGYGSGVQNTRTQTKLGLLERCVDAVIHGSGILFPGRRVLVLCGDIFDSHLISEDIRSAFASAVSRALAVGVDVVYIEGNHSRVGLSTPLRSEQIMAMIAPEKSCGEFTVCWEPTEILLSYPWRILAVPYQRTDAIEDYLKRTDFTQRRTLLFGHFPVRGGWQSDQHVTDSGVDPELLKPFDSVFLGDFHRRQVIAETPKGFHG